MKKTTVKEFCTDVDADIMDDHEFSKYKVKVNLEFDAFVCDYNDKSALTSAIMGFAEWVANNHFYLDDEDVKVSTKVTPQ